jgi:hypothetical protein
MGLRLALIGTPRSGNTWLRHLLAKLYAAPELAVHDPAEIAWSALPRDCVLQMHQHRTLTLQNKLTRHGFRVVVLARHPLDVLISILHFATHDGSTSRWLAGERGDESPIHGAMPCSAAFLDYTQGKRAAALLSISPQWWDVPGCLRVSYESLALEPGRELARIAGAVGLEPRIAVAKAVAATTLPRMRLLLRGRHHFWQGKAGHWKRLLVADVAGAIAASHAAVLERFNYDCAADPHLTRSQADAHWIDLNRGELTEKLWHYIATRHELDQTREQLAGARQQLDLLGTAAAQLQRHCRAAHQAVANARQCPKEQLQPMAAELARIDELLASGQQNLGAAQLNCQALAARLAMPWKNKWVRFRSLLARTVRRVLGLEKGSGTVVRSTLRAAGATVPDPFSKPQPPKNRLSTAAVTRDTPSSTGRELG